MGSLSIILQSILLYSYGIMLIMHWVLLHCKFSTAQLRGMNQKNIDMQSTILKLGANRVFLSALEECMTNVREQQVRGNEAPPQSSSQANTGTTLRVTGDRFKHLCLKKKKKKISSQGILKKRAISFWLPWIPAKKNLFVESLGSLALHSKSPGAILPRITRKWRNMEVNEKKEKIPRLSRKWTRRVAESLDGLF